MPKMNDDFELRPVIRELARTRVCFPDIKLLVDKITIVKLSATNPAATNEAYRLYLTDGDMTIQGPHFFLLPWDTHLTTPPLSTGQAPPPQISQPFKYPRGLVCESERI